MSQPPTDAQQPASPTPPPPPARENPTAASPQPPAQPPAPSQNPNPPPSDPITPSQPRPRPVTRPWQPPQPSAVAVPPPQRGVGVAIGVPAHHTGQTPPVQSTSSASSSQSRPGLIGTLGSSSQLRPTAISQQRPVQSHSFRMPVPPIAQPSSSPGNSLLRGPSMSFPASSSLSTSQPMPSPNQPWLSSTSQVKLPLPAPSFRQQLNPPSMHQRSHIPQQTHHPPSSTASHPTHHTSSSQTQQPVSNQPPDQYGAQFSSSKSTQLTPNQQTVRPIGGGPPRPPMMIQPQPTAAPSVRNGKSSVSETEDSCNRILSKRTISELVNQIDPLGKLDPVVEDILLDVAEEFIDSITTFSCSLAKHRKSNTLEAKDILLHLERNWNITLPGFSGDEIKSYRKQVINDVHKERIAVVKRSIALADSASNRNTPGQTAGAAKSSLVKTPANILGSPNMKN
ncbi:hypothetical protein MLD38_026631 [Melastoma candidum]|uniref:Uncharacterized protein n=1 Tax=Melastoma candidum TaxID=119954 RepID=A0ACB9P2Q0_9MYRT|nr:hypothetical protein MLD38_026631 [Melastoma candidum]